MSTTQFIDELAAGNASGAKDMLNDMLSARAFEALEGRKVEIAQNIFNGSQVQEEEVELEEASTYKLGRAAAETKDFPIHHNGEHVGRLEFHTSAGKLHHRVSSVAGVPSEKFVSHPDREKMTNAHVAKHEAEARKHFAKKIKEEVEITQEEFDQLDEISKKTATSAYVARMGREDDKSPDKAVKTMDRIYKKHGATGVMRAATAADKKYGIHSADYTKKDFVGDYLSGQGK